MVVLLGVTILLLIAESYFPLKTPSERLKHLGQNAFLFLVARLGFFVVSLLALERFSFYSLRETFGKFFVVYVFVVSDLTVYWWHRFNHRLPFLWRFHQVHHVDSFLDVSSALRFHVGEMVLSYLYRTVFYLLLGLEMREVLWYNVVLTCGNLFIHSNLSLPKNFERRLSRVIVTPRIHRTHHSLYRLHTDSNYSTTWIGWDHLFGSFSGICETPEVGVPYRKDSDLKSDLRLPLEPLKPWPKLYKGSP